MVASSWKTGQPFEPGWRYCRSCCTIHLHAAQLIMPSAFVRRFRDFCEGHIWTPNTLRSPSQNEHFGVSGQNLKSLARMLPLMSVFWWSLFWSKTVFLPKKYHRLLGVKTYENHQNRCSLTVWFWVGLVKKYSFLVDAYVTQRMTRSIIFS